MGAWLVLFLEIDHVLLVDTVQLMKNGNGRLLSLAPPSDKFP